MCIVLRAQYEYDVRKTNKKIHGAYYEVHHILPKSLGGSNDKTNLVMLTAREHFICHWLLVKIYPKGSNARDKMLIALWRMSGESGVQVGKRYINAHAYSTLRSEFQACNRKKMQLIQSGENNSQYGWHWYTNAYTGDTTKFAEPPEYPWIRGRNLFHGEYNRLTYFLDSDRHDHPKRSTSLKNSSRASKFLIMRQAKQQTEILWNQFHNSDVTSLAEFSKRLGVSSNAIRKRFKKHIPIFSIMKSSYVITPNKLLIGVYVDCNRPEA